EQRAGVDFADVYRANEIHGLVFDDANHNHLRDAGEAGIPGVSVYVDVNRNDVADADEPRTVTDTDGVYAFTTALAPCSRAAFPQIIASLQAALPGVDLGFGVGRFEEYANFAAENATGRPFILNQPIISASTTGFSAAIQAALDRTAPGYGGDQPETDIEAL